MRSASEKRRERNGPTSAAVAGPPMFRNTMAVPGLVVDCDIAVLDDRTGTIAPGLLAVPAAVALAIARDVKKFGEIE
jgi:hypothetical protein